MVISVGLVGEVCTVVGEAVVALCGGDSGGRGVDLSLVALDLGVIRTSVTDGSAVRVHKHTL